MSNGPDPALVYDWFTWWGVLFVAACVAAVWVTAYILTPKTEPKHVVGWGVEYENVPVSPCAPHGHRYVAQPVTWRCSHCGDERTPEGAYDQDAA